jgi:hypothetical protein
MTNQSDPLYADTPKDQAVTKWRKKPVVVEAMQYTAETCRALCEWADARHDDADVHGDSCGCEPLEMSNGPDVYPNDYVVKEGRAFRVYTPPQFLATYEPADSGASE